MVQSETPSFDELETVDTTPDDADDGDAEWLDLDAGEAVVGEIRALKPNCGEHNTTVIELARGLGDVVVMWSNPNFAWKRNSLRSRIATA